MVQGLAVMPGISRSGSTIAVDIFGTKPWNGSTLLFSTVNPGYPWSRDACFAKFIWFDDFLFSNDYGHCFSICSRVFLLEVASVYCQKRTIAHFCAFLLDQRTCCPYFGEVKNKCVTWNIYWTNKQALYNILIILNLIWFRRQLKTLELPDARSDYKKNLYRQESKE